MGVVWRGHDRTTGAVYAIKVLRSEYARDPAAVGRFVRERTALVAFRHPNVVTVHDMIVEGDQLALVMDLVPGGDLAGLRKARGGRLAPAEAASLAAQIADGLAAAHAAGIVHRDLKPANALFNNDQVLLADFGIALLAGEPQVTTAGQVLGTAAYLPPEVISGQEPGPAGDVYALGITLYELLAGQPPFTGNTAAILHAQVTAAPPRAPGIPDRAVGGHRRLPGQGPGRAAVGRPGGGRAARVRRRPRRPGGRAQRRPSGRRPRSSGRDPLQAAADDRDHHCGTARCWRAEATPGTAPRRPRAGRRAPRSTAPKRRQPSRRTVIIGAVSVAAVAVLAVGAGHPRPVPVGRLAPAAGQLASCRAARQPVRLGRAPRAAHATRRAVPARPGPGRRPGSRTAARLRVARDERQGQPVGLRPAAHTGPSRRATVPRRRRRRLRRAPG